MGGSVPSSEKSSWKIDNGMELAFGFHTNCLRGEHEG